MINKEPNNKMFKELSTELKTKMPITCGIEDKFAEFAYDALRKGDEQTWNLYMTACALARRRTAC